MSEKRKPETTILVRGNKQKSNKIEVFKASAWHGDEDKYRIRMNGRFYPFSDSAHVYKFYSMKEVLDIIHNELEQFL